jgi:hypothetical protein
MPSIARDRKKKISVRIDEVAVLVDSQKTSRVGDDVSRQPLNQVIITGIRRPSWAGGELLAPAWLLSRGQCRSWRLLHDQERRQGYISRAALNS